MGLASNQPHLFNIMAEDYGMAEASESEGRGDSDEGTFFLPADFPGHEDCKAGDTITLQVVGKDENGEVEVKHVGYGRGEPPWKQDLRQTMAAPSAPQEME